MTVVNLHNIVAEMCHIDDIPKITGVLEEFIPGENNCEVFRKWANNKYDMDKMTVLESSGVTEWHTIIQIWKCDFMLGAVYWCMDI